MSRHAEIERARRSVNLREHARSSLGLKAGDHLCVFVRVYYKCMLAQNFQSAHARIVRWDGSTRSTLSFEVARSVSGSTLGFARQLR